MTFPTTIIAGISVPDTPLVRSAIIQAKSESPVWLVNHVMRSWLFAVRLAQFENVTLDEETLAVAAILHDIGLVPKYESLERRFEVDGAVSAVSFLQKHRGKTDSHSPAPDSVNYFKHRLRELTVWDAIAMHTTPSLAQHTVPEVSFCQRGVAVDIAGGGMEHLPDGAATFDAVIKAYPLLDVTDRFRDCLCSVVRNKPQTTYDNFVGAIGQAYVEGYKRSNAEEEVLVACLRPS